jgi:tRNA 2-thiouridine synthesizing protein A
MSTKMDFKGMACPMPIMKTAMAFKKAASGDEFEVVCDDPGFEPDITAWASETGNTLKGITKDGKDLTAILVKK